ncbi:MAG: hypothetical protein A4E67_00043 [Syntrophaceae bacterium PtaB.Bin038]|nr:MAG: hypothetical protein A4E67_00043 [Syntrophaceae bacterium PtaB.Bin038]
MAFFVIRTRPSRMDSSPPGTHSFTQRSRVTPMSVKNCTKYMCCSRFVSPIVTVERYS